MYLVALKMLVGDRLKYIGLVVSLSFASFIISQQSAIFVGILKRTFGFVTDTSQANIWVVDPSVQYIGDIKGMKNTAYFRIRGVEGVDWAVPLYYGTIPARLRNGIYQTCIFIGIDDATLIGGPPRMLEGSIEDLRFPDAIIVDRVGANTKLAHRGKNGEVIPLRIGDVMELNDNRAYVAGICEVSRTFQSQPVIYTTYGAAMLAAPVVRDFLSFVLVKSRPGIDPEKLCERIRAETGYAAYTSWGIQKLTMLYYAKFTGIVVNFGVAIILGFIIGMAIAGQTFFNFILDNLPYFGTFKAMGANNSLLVKMIIIQALFVSAIGWGIGIGGASLFGWGLRHTELSFSLPWWLYIFTALSMLFICFAAAVFSVLRVVRVDPAIVFKS
jgi:putative ABC transport system permease protein